MKIVICIKPIKSELVYANETREEDFVINPYDLYALEETVALKKYIDCQIICLSMGPLKAKEVLQRAIAIGVDEGIILNDDVFRGSDTVATSYILAEAIKKIGNVDLVVCGKQAVDGETGQVVYGIGQRLDYECIPNMAEIVEAYDNKLKVKTVEELNDNMGVLTTPAIVSFYNFKVTQPKVGLLALKKARKREIPVWNANDLELDTDKCGLEGSKTKVLNIEREFVKKPKSYIEGSIEEKVHLITDILRGKI